MTEEQNDIPAEESTHEPAAEVTAETTTESAAADAAWGDVISQLDELAEAAGKWTRAAVDDPENRRRAREFKEHIESMARGIGDAIDSGVSKTASSDVGEVFKGAAVKTGDAFKAAGQSFTDEVAPRMASAFRGAAEKLDQAAQKMNSTDEVATDATEAPASETSESPSDESAE